MQNSTLISSISGAHIIYYGGKLNILSNTSYIHASCSTNYSIAIGINRSLDDNNYSINILENELLSFYSNNLIMDSNLILVQYLLVDFWWFY